jgi:hypothetical protein
LPGEAESLGGKEGLRLTKNSVERLLIHAQVTLLHLKARVKVPVRVGRNTFQPTPSNLQNTS